MTTLSKPRHIQTSPGQPPATRFVLRSNEQVAHGLRRIMVEQVDLAAFHVQHVPGSDEHVHEVRKATKRVRAVLRMVRHEIGHERYRELNKTVRDIARELSSARSSAVMVDVLEGLVDGDPTLTSIGGMQHGLHLDRERELLAVDAALTEDLSTRLARVGAQLGEVALTGGGAVSRRGVQRTYRRGRQRMTQAFATGSAVSFHMWRKQVKYLRHQMEVLAEVGPDGVAELIQDLESLGEELGQDNDLADLEHWIDRSNPSMSGEATAILDAIASARSQLESTLRTPAVRLFLQKPSAFVDEVLPALA